MRGRFDGETNATDRPAIVVLFRDDTLLVVAKPSGMAIHRGWCAEGPFVVDQARTLVGTSGVHPIHRLDRGASGVVVLALDAGVARQLAEQRARRRLERRYLALVRGEPPESGLVEHDIPRRPAGPRVRASTSFACLHSAATEPRRTSLVEAVPHTGRLHQVRRHLKHIGHPVIGDTTYGKGELNRALAERYALGRLALHAHVVTLRHPSSGTALTVRAPLPDDLAGPLVRMGFPATLWRG